MVYAVVRVRGTVNIKPDIRKTLELLRLTRTNHCVLVEENEIYKGMLQKVKDYTAWGELSKDTLNKLMKSKAKLIGEKELTDEYIKSSTSFGNIEKMSDAIIENKIKFKEIPEIKPLFRLNPPKKGFEGIKKSYKNGGALGYRGKEINNLIERMI